jgi:DNA polymerase-1
MFEETKGCQFQNLPNQFKRLFSARNPGWLMAEADYSQLEYRVAGFLGKDPVIYKEVREGFDVHKYTASVMNDVPLEEVTYTMRRDAKADTFKPVYGGSRGTPEQEAYYDAFQKKYSALKDTQEGWCLLVENNKLLETEWGMKYYWPTAKVNRGGYLNVKTKVYNYAIQAFATAEIVPIGLAMFWHRSRDAEMFLVNTVHDSIEVELPENEIELFADLVVQSLAEDVHAYLMGVYNIDFDMPIGVGMVVGTNWSVPSVSDDKWHDILADMTLRGHDYEVSDGEATVTYVN